MNSKTAKAQERGVLAHCPYPSTGDLNGNGLPCLMSNAKGLWPAVSQPAPQAPLINPSCQRSSPVSVAKPTTDAQAVPETSHPGLTTQKYGRFWAVHDRDDLVCLCVYRKGAKEVVRRLTACACSSRLVGGVV